MNAIKTGSVLVVAVIAGLAAGAAIARNADADEGVQRKEHITRQGVHREKQHANREQRHANNPSPRQDAPRAVPPRHSPPASVPSRPGHNNGNNHNNGKGHDNGKGHNNSGGHYAGGGNPHFVPPPRYNNPGRAHTPRYTYPPNYRYTPRYANSPAYGNAHRHVRPPRYVKSLPYGYHRHYWNGSPYYYHGGYWYRPYGASYVVASAPYGLFVPFLPFYSSLWFGSTRYYYSEGNYYNYEPVRRGYVVARSPYVEDSDEAEDLYFYPAQGQSEQQQTDDRYECHRWAVGQTNYDPVDASYDAQRRSEYDRALTACMTGRGYTVS